MGNQRTMGFELDGVYHANREEIEADLQRETLIAQALERQYTQAGESAL